METWKEITGYEGYYEISDIGNVRGKDRIINGRWGKQFRKGRLVKTVSRNGYVAVELTKEKKRRGFYVHRLVLSTFVGDCPKGFEGSHLNGNRKDNRVHNLVWEGRKENLLRKEEHGTGAKGSKNPYSKLNEETVRIIKKLLSILYDKEIAKIYGVSPGCIWTIRTGRAWNHVE